MRIGIDARMMGKGYGIGRYIEQLVAGLLWRGGENQYVFFVRSEEQRGEMRDQRVQSTECEIVVADIPWYSLDEQIRFSSFLKQAHVDLMHFPHWNIPLFYNDPFVVTIHDLTMYHFSRPEATTLGPVTFWIKDRAHRLVVRHAVRVSRHIIATSEWTKQDIVQTFGASKEKIRVVYQAPLERWTADHHRQGGAGHRQGGAGRLQATDFFEKQGITKPYVLYVGAAYPHKNLERLLQAWTSFQERYGGEYQLVLVGKNDTFYKRITDVSVLSFQFSHNKQSPVSSFQSSIISPGIVSDKELNMLYQYASLFIFPSLYEGFGLPPLEAFVHGVPVAASTASCLPEILGEGAIYFDPLNIEQMAEVIARGLLDEDIRCILKQNAREELRRFSFGRFIRQTLCVYHDAKER